MGEQLVKQSLPIDNSGITVEFHRSAFDMATLVVFRIPDSAHILSRDPHEFMRWCYEQMMTIAAQSRKVRP